ncbi:CrcB family protein [uncultured Nonlabens sp.]|uniref:fluoride efflux transporter FluC n=1 Tax=uncultured Nonlabens sp. TaxID=859306 RepID=UPI00262F7E73|nr:CrcB family protein [uncultured Nonlabens sp.]
MKTFLFVFIGGGLGSSLRFYLSLIENSSNLKWIPTIGTNILGCLLLGGFLAAFHKEQLSHQWYVLLGIGFCGGLTTFSTFSAELFSFLKNGSYASAMWYLILSISLGIVAAGTSYKFTEAYLLKS